MNIKQLNEVFSIYSDGRFKYADIDAKAVYDNCINKDFGSHTIEEANKFKEFVNITPETDEEQLRALRNTLVKYWADYVKEYKGDDWGRSRSKEESDKEFKMGDQMQFFTTVIDMAIDNLPEDKRMSESLEGCYIVTMNGEPIGPNFKTRKEASDWAERNYEIDDERIAIEFDPEPSYDEDEDLAESKNEEYKITNKDRVDTVKEDAEDLQKAIESICNKFEFYSKKWDDEKQQNFADRIMEIMETAETNLKNVIKRMK